MRDAIPRKISEEWTHIVQLSRLGMTRKYEDLEKYIRRIAASAPTAVSIQLSDLLVAGQFNRSNGARAATPAPVDSDSRLSLLKIDHEPIPSRSLFYSETITKSLDRFVAERQAVEKLLAAGVAPPNSMIFSGPPGVGKTKGAEMIAARLSLPLLTLDLSAVMSSYLGKTGQNIRFVLDYAKSFPCVLLLDEFDSIAKRRDANDDSGELRRLVNVLLQEIDEWPYTGVLIAATNHAELIDPAIWRRFDHLIQFFKPSRAEIECLVLNRFDAAVDAKIARIASFLFQDMSQSEIDNVLERVKRDSVLRDESIEACLLETIRPLKVRLSKFDKMEIAVGLHEFGFPVREIGEILEIGKTTVARWIK